jgi:hypothetical protein
MASNYPPGVTGFEYQIAGGYETQVFVDCYECEKEIDNKIDYSGPGSYELTCDKCGKVQNRKLDLE